MDILRNILIVCLVLVCIALVLIILAQKGKKAGLTGAVGGSGADTFWQQNKGRSKEGRLDNLTKILVAAFMVISLLIGVLS